MTGHGRVVRRGHQRARLARAGSALLFACLSGVVCCQAAALAASPLPDGRAYELVTPVDKNGGDVDRGLLSTANGNRLAFVGTTAFANAKSNQLASAYVATRGPTGWMTTNMSPALGAGLALNGAFFQVGSLSSDLSTSIMNTPSGTAEPGVRNIYATNLNGATTWITQPNQFSSTIAPKFYAGRSDDASHIVFESTQNFTSTNTMGSSEVWEWVAGQGISLVSILPDGTAASGATVGSGANAVTTGSTSIDGELPEPTAVSSDGSRIFFSANGTTSTGQLFVRENGSTTVEVSLSQKSGSIGQEAPDGVKFAGASVDGSRVVFTSEDELTDDATSGGGVYEYDLNDNTLEFLSPDPSDAAGAQVEGVAQVSADGSHVYYVAHGQLVAGEGQAGGNNLYVWHNGVVQFIATLADNDIQDWATNDFLLAPHAKTSRSTPDGEHFVFQSFNALTGYDTDGHDEIYEWNEPTASLACVSCGPPGGHADGDASLLGDPINPTTGLTSDFQLQVGSPRNITDDGRRVFFETTDSLDPRDVNGKEDVYEWESDGSGSCTSSTDAGGCLYLISSGTSTADSEIVDNTPSGSDVFFTTHDSLVPQDTDGGAGDIYDARIGGGFPPPVATPGCTGDACQAPPTPAPPTPVAGSASFKGPGNPNEPPPPVTRFSILPVTPRARGEAARTGRLTLEVKVSEPGKVSVTARARSGARMWIVARRSVQERSAGTRRVVIVLGPRARTQLARRRVLRLEVTVAYSKVAQARHTSVTLHASHRKGER